jgi:peroxiredoxin
MVVMRVAWFLSVPLLVVACGGGDSNGDGTDGGVDLAPPPECALTAPPDDWVYPAGPYGDEIGETLENFTLDDCDGNEIDFGDVLGQSEITLVSIGSGWCDPCIEESETLDSEVFREFCPRGLQVVQILFEDELSRPATKLFCSEWRERYTMSFPVVVDPLFVTGKYFETIESQTPINFLVTNTGEIVFKSLGTPAFDLPDRLDELLPE